MQINIKFDRVFEVLEDERGGGAITIRSSKDRKDHLTAFLTKMERRAVKAAL